MATIYSDPLGSNTSPYDTWEKAANLIQTAVTLASAGDTVIIQNGNWSENFDTKANGSAGSEITVQGKAGGTTHITRVGTGDSSEALEIDHSHWNFNNIVFDGGAVHSESRGPIKITNGADYLTFNDIEITGAGQFQCHDAVGKTKVEFNRCIVNGHHLVGTSSETSSMYFQGAPCNITFNYCKFTAGNGKRIYPIYARNAITMVFNNCFFGGFITNVFYAYDNGNSFTARNCVFLSHNDGMSGSVPVFFRRGDNNSTFDVDYSYLLPGVDDVTTSPLWGGANVTDGGHNETLTAPGIGKVGHGNGMINLAVDDSFADSDVDLIEELTDVCDTYNVHMTWFVNPSYIINGPITSAPAIAMMQSIVAAGHEVAAHGYSHTPMDTTTGIVVTGTGTSPTVDIDRAGDQIVCNDVENGNQIVSGFKAKLISAIISEIDAFTGWSATGGAYAAAFVYSLGESLDDSTGAQAAGAGYTTDLLLDTSCATGFFKVEVADCKTWIEANITDYTCSTFGYGTGTYSEDAKTAVENAGFDLGRTTYNVDGDISYRSIPQFAVSTTRGHIVHAGELEDGLRLMARALVYSLQIGEFAFGIYWHNSADMDAERLGWILDEINNVDLDNEVTVGTYKEFFSYLDDTNFYTESANVYTMVTDSYNIQDDLVPVTGSLLIDSGVDVGLTTDFILATVPENSVPDMGLYEVLYVSTGNNRWNMSPTRWNGNGRYGSGGWI